MKPLSARIPHFHFKKCPEPLLANGAVGNAQRQPPDDNQSLLDVQLLGRGQIVRPARRSLGRRLGLGARIFFCSRMLLNELDALQQHRPERLDALRQFLRGAITALETALSDCSTLSESPPAPSCDRPHLLPLGVLWASIRDSSI